MSFVRTQSRHHWVTKCESLFPAWTLFQLHRIKYYVARPQDKKKRSIMLQRPKMWCPHMWAPGLRRNSQNEACWSKVLFAIMQPYCIVSLSLPFCDLFDTLWTGGNGFEWRGYQTHFTAENSCKVNMHGWPANKTAFGGFRDDAFYFFYFLARDKTAFWVMFGKRICCSF